MSNSMYEPTRDVDAEHAGSIVAAALLAMNLFCPSNDNLCQELDEAHFPGGANIA
jgi:hypothetical protein